MVTRRRALALGTAVLSIVSIWSLVFDATMVAQQAQAATRKLTDAEKKEIQTILKIVDDVAAGQPAPNDLSLAWGSSDLLKAQNNKEYLPFTVSFDRSKLSSGKVTMYWRVVNKGAAAAPAPAPTATDGKKDDKKPAKPEYPYEDINTLTLPAADSAGPARISRSFTVGAGDYDVYVVVKEPTPEKAKKGDPAPKVSLIKQTLTIPDLWNGELN